MQELYNSKYEYYKILKDKVDEKILFTKNNRWHYESRLKELESFALKLETGRFDIKDIFDDFFAATIVVKNNSEIYEAVNFVKSFSKIKYRKPLNKRKTHKKSFEFSFDDLRLYVSLKDDRTGVLCQDMLKFVFEIQIKTFFQHAWSIATHDLIYKCHEINWGKERIAYQVKAFLEHAEVTINSVDKLSSMDELDKEDELTCKVNKLIKLLKSKWNSSDLPNDCRRLAQNVLKAIKLLDISTEELESILDEETKEGMGINIRNLSPYFVIIQSICNKRNEKIESYAKENKNDLLFTSDLNLKNVSLTSKDKLYKL